jgi:hypothetical protein
MNIQLMHLLFTQLKQEKRKEHQIKLLHYEQTLPSGASRSAHHAPAARALALLAQVVALQPLQLVEPRRALVQQQL